MYYLMLLLAIVCETAGTTLLKYSEQFTRVVPSIASLACYVASLYFLSVCLKVIPVTDRGELQNLAEIKTVHSPRKLDCTQDLADLFMGYVCEVHTCDINTNHVFLKLRGENAGKPMDYSDVDNLFRTLRKKTGIQITPHVFRHTSLSLLYADGWAPELLRIRAGHKNIYTTINTYIHPTEEELTAAFNKAAPHLSRPDLGRKEGDA